MEDPWSTPWAVTTPSVSPGLPPTQPKATVAAAAAAPEGLSATRGDDSAITPMKGGLGLGRLDTFSESPWGGASTTTTTTTNYSLDSKHETNAARQNGTPDNIDEDEEDVWGGWNDGKEQNAWSSHNGDSGLSASKSQVDNDDDDAGFSAPWGFMDSNGAGQEVQHHHDGRIKDVTDSAVSFGEQGRHDALDDSAREGTAVGEGTTMKAVSLLADEQRTWDAPQEDVIAKSQAMSEMHQTTTTSEKATDTTEEEVLKDETEKPILEGPGPAGELQDDNVHADAAQAPEMPQEQKAASKVQELVDMYDGIAKKAVLTPPERISREPTPAPTAEIAGDEEAIAEIEQPHQKEEEKEDGAPTLDTEENLGKDGELEEHAPAGKFDKEDSVALESVPEKAPVLADATHEDAAGSIPLEDIERNINSDEEATSPSLDVKPPRLAPSTSKSNHPAYPIDLSHLDTLFPGSKPSTTIPEPVPEFMIDNSFTTTSERKSWYRISRFGSTRKHDSGDEDNYRRITWPTSEVRTKTLHIVRRWMEEDSIAGRVVLGSKKAGVPLGASMFNWDSSEPAIEIGELLRQRVQQQQQPTKKEKHVAHSRNRSWTPATEEGLPPLTPTLESFGGGEWTTSVPSTPSAVFQSPAFAAHIKAKARSALARPPLNSPKEMLPKSPWDEEDDAPQQEKEAVGRKRSNELMPPPPLPRINTTAVETDRKSLAKEGPAPEEANGEEDDDDDWGEMMSSPTVDASATFASLGAPAEIKPAMTSTQLAFDEGGFGGLDFFNSTAPAKPVTSAMARPNVPPPIQTTKELHHVPATSSPIWTPTMNSPALEPARRSLNTNRVSLETSQKSSTPTMASTPVFGSSRVSMNSNRPSMENAWGADHKDMDKSLQSTASAGSVPYATPPATASIQAGIKRVSFEDTCTIDREAVVEEALRSIPDLSYMLR